MFIHVSDDAKAEVCCRFVAGRILEQVRDRIPGQTPRMRINLVRRSCVGLRDICDSQRDAMVTTGHQLDAERFAVEDVLLEELESLFN